MVFVYEKQDKGRRGPGVEETELAAPALSSSRSAPASIRTSVGTVNFPLRFARVHAWVRVVCTSLDHVYVTSVHTAPAPPEGCPCRDHSRTLPFSTRISCTTLDLFLKHTDTILATLKKDR